MNFYNFILSILVKLFGEYWFVFISYMVFNFLDWITGYLKSMKLKCISSQIGIKGLLKKLGYWIVIGIAFCFSSIFVIIGDEIGINLSIMYLLGWFTFALLLINEIISILENLVALNVKVPAILINSLKQTEELLDNASEKLLNKDEFNNKNLDE